MDDRVKKFLEDARSVGRSADPLSRLRNLQESVEGIQSAIQEMIAQEFVASDQRELVSATTSSAGLKAVSITPRAMRDLDNEELANACLEAIRNSRSELAKGMKDQMRALSDVEIPDEGQIGDRGSIDDTLESLKRL
jgi:DNA-binding protein YbaB